MQKLELILPVDYPSGPMKHVASNPLAVESVVAVVVVVAFASIVPMMEEPAMVDLPTDKDYPDTGYGKD